MIPGSLPTMLLGTDDATVRCPCPRCTARRIDGGWLTNSPPKTQLRHGVIDPAVLVGWADLERIAGDPRTTTNTRLKSVKQTHTARDTVAQRLTSGSTLQVQNCERADSTIAFVCAELQRAATSTTVGCNAYVSPASGVPGLHPHRDNTHTTIVQLEGSKEWTVWSASPPPREQKLAEGDWDPTTDDAAEVVVQAELRPGDVLQIALGDPHVAMCRTGPSVHLTFAHRPIRGSDVFGMALEYVERDRTVSRDWCQTVTPAEIDAWVESSLASFSSLLDQLRAHPDLHELVAADLIGRRLDDDGSLRDHALADERLLTGLGVLASMDSPIPPSGLVGALPKLITLPPHLLTADNGTPQTQSTPAPTPAQSAICHQVLASPHSALLVTDLANAVAPQSLPVDDLMVLSERGYVFLTTAGSPSC